MCWDKIHRNESSYSVPAFYLFAHVDTIADSRNEYLGSFLKAADLSPSIRVNVESLALNCGLGLLVVAGRLEGSYNEACERSQVVPAAG